MFIHFIALSHLQKQFVQNFLLNSNRYSGRFIVSHQKYLYFKYKGSNALLIQLKILFAKNKLSQEMASCQRRKNIDMHMEIESQGSTEGEDRNWTRASMLEKSRIKSSLCKNYTQYGFCPYGYKCQFAHGLEQLQQHESFGLYKTKACVNFTKKSYCRYGYRCNFQHTHWTKEQSERKKAENFRHLAKNFLDIISLAKSASGSKINRIIN